MIGTLEYLLQKDMEAILQVPLSRRQAPNAIMWLPNKNGVFLVKSCYHMTRLLSQKVGGSKESSVRNDRGLMWQKLWKCQLPNKIKIFG